MASRTSENGKITNQSASLADHVYGELLKSLRDGVYHPGERIREAVIARQLSVSRTPVREAIRRLQSEGRLKFEPQRGAVVAELDRQQVAELYDLRESLEGTAAHMAAQHASDAEIQAMFSILEKTAAMTADPRELNQINWRFHHSIYHAAHNRYLIKAFSAVADSMALLRGVKYIPENRPQQLYEEHLLIADAIRNRDSAAAEHAAREHVRQAFRIHLETAFQDFAS
ncbi:MAG: GntR family transcriptional regulator [Rhizobiaceae bacterium MnEN-MB40S]|nr:MAG: GntR family transcriptional regulator [Rhizobiaceae bacterium MnEN-MB40S]